MAGCIARGVRAVGDVLRETRTAYDERDPDAKTMLREGPVGPKQHELSRQLLLGPSRTP